MTLCRCVECAEKLTIRAHSALRSSGSAERTQRTIPITPSSTDCAPLLVGQIFEAAGRSRPDRIDEHVEFAVPSLSKLGEHVVDLTGVTDVGNQPEGIRAAADPSTPRRRSRARSGVRPITATRAPSSAKHRAAAKPMPRLPPTTAAAAFASPRSMAQYACPAVFTRNPTIGITVADGQPHEAARLGR